MAALTPWRFYVYEFSDATGLVTYIGKGSGGRLVAQRRRFGPNGHEVARFKRERDAYAYEVERIAQMKPTLNRHKGGNGSFATPRRARRREPWELEIERIGTRVYAARMLLRFLPGIKHMGLKVDIDEAGLREAAYG